MPRPPSPCSSSCVLWPEVGRGDPVGLPPALEEPQQDPRCAASVVEGPVRGAAWLEATLLEGARQPYPPASREDRQLVLEADAAWEGAVAPTSLRCCLDLALVEEAPAGKDGARWVDGATELAEHLRQGRARFDILLSQAGQGGAEGAEGGQRLRPHHSVVLPCAAALLAIDVDRAHLDDVGNEASGLFPPRMAGALEIDDDEGWAHGSLF